MNGLQLPAEVMERLTVWSEALQKGLGDDLVAILIHGSAVRGGYRANESDVDAVVVLQNAPLSKLEAIGNACQAARYGARIEAMFLIESEISSAADAFPLFYSEIQGKHHVLVGKDPFKSIQIEKKHLRLRIEQELREIQIRLRRAVIDAMGDHRVIGGVLERKIKQARSPLAALLALHKKETDGTLGAVLDGVHVLYDVDIAPLRAVRENAKLAFPVLVTILEKAIADVDQMGDKQEGDPV